MTKLETIHNLAIIGGIGAAISPVLTLIISPFYLNWYWVSPYYFIYSFGMVLFLITFLTGILACVMAVRASGYVAKMPQRAASDLTAAGALVIVVGFIALLNILVIISGIVILIAGAECRETWKRIERARHRTGWPYTTVATAAGSIWSRRVSCRFCGAPLVTMSAMATGHLVRVETICPLDETRDTIRLPLSQLESWAPVIADRLHRCVKCGERTAALIIVRQTGVSSRLQAYCTRAHQNRIYRKIWTPLYPHVAQTPRVDVGFQSAPHPSQFRPSFQDHPHIPVTQPIPISASTTVVTRAGPIRFCTQCGVNVESSDRYCSRCGATIR